MEKSAQMKAEMIELLKNEQTSYNESLSEARKSHHENQLRFLSQFTTYIGKLGELSILLGSAIGPIIIASEAKIKEPQFIFYAIGLYLLNGIWALWRAKSLVEISLDSYAPAILHDLETRVYPMSFSANKLLLDLIQDKEDESHKKEYVMARANFLEANTQLVISNKRNPDLTLDFLMLIFVVASMFLLKEIWPYNSLFYWLMFQVVLISMLGKILQGSIAARKQRQKNDASTAKLNKMKSEHLEWQKSVGIL